MINIQNIYDNKCFEWSIVRYLNPANHQPARIIKTDKDFAKKFDSKDINFPVKIRDILKIEEKKTQKKRIPLALVFLANENKEKHPIYVSKNVVKKNMLICY